VSNLKKSIIILFVLTLPLKTLAEESSSVQDSIESNYQSGLFYIGLGNSDNTDILDNEPWSVGLVIRDEDSFYGFDIGGEGIMIERSRNYDNTYTVDSTEQALSFNILAGLKVTENNKFRLDLGLIAGLLEKSSECPSSYGSYQCYYSSVYDNRADYEYTFNYGLAIHATYERITFGVRATGESTQMLFGINF
tara:strand:+ start:2616 stop:3194 length:579 start_codon:yes stop_codon:yes gene_type:complete